MFFPDSVRTAVARLEAAGYEAYPVGGCVRDFFLGRACSDFDITTNALPDETARVFAGERVIETGIKHGTVTVILAGEPIEITTFRVDLGYTDGRHPDAVAFTPSLYEDLARRDFTVNAMAYRAGEAIDPFGGMADLKKKRIRCVGNPEARFTEDGLRILRALRFASTLGFTIEPSTAQAMEVCKGQLNRVSVERITVEVTKLALGQNAAQVVREHLPILREVLPDCEPDFAKLATLPPQTELRLAALLGRVTALDALRLPKREEARIARLLTAEKPSDLLRTLRAYGAEDAALLYAYHKMEFALPDRAIWSVAQLAVNGVDLKAHGLCGQEIGRVLELLLDAVMDGTVENEKSALLAKVREI